MTGCSGMHHCTLFGFSGFEFSFCLFVFFVFVVFCVVFRPCLGQEIWKDSSLSKELWRESFLSEELGRESFLCKELWRESPLSKQVWKDFSLSNELWKESSLSKELWQESSLSKELWRFPLKCRNLYEFTSLLKGDSSHEFSKTLLELCLKCSLEVSELTWFHEPLENSFFQWIQEAPLGVIFKRFPLKCNNLYDFTGLLKGASSHEFSKPLWFFSK